MARTDGQTTLHAKEPNHSPDLKSVKEYSVCFLVAFSEQKEDLNRPNRPTLEDKRARKSGGTPRSEYLGTTRPRSQHKDMGARASERSR